MLTEGKNLARLYCLVVAIPTLASRSLFIANAIFMMKYTHRIKARSLTDTFATSAISPDFKTSLFQLSMLKGSPPTALCKHLNTEKKSTKEQMKLVMSLTNTN